MPQALNELLSAIKSIEPLPEVAMRVFSLSRDPEVVPRELVEVVQTDAGMTAKVLKLTNSSLYGFRRRIASLQEAGNLLGVRTLVNLVLTSCAGRYFRDYGRAQPERGRALWAESVSNALAANLLARWNPSVDASQAYTAGLLQNIGRTVIERFLVRERELIEAEVERGLPLVEAEARIVGLDHAEIGARLAERWSFPEVLVDSIRWHHQPERATAHIDLAFVLHLAEELTTRLAKDAEASDPAIEFPAEASRRAHLDPGDFTTLRDMLARELGRATEFVELA